MNISVSTWFENAGIKKVLTAVQSTLKFLYYVHVGEVVLTDIIHFLGRIV